MVLAALASVVLAPLLAFRWAARGLHAVGKKNTRQACARPGLCCEQGGHMPSACMLPVTRGCVMSLTAPLTLSVRNQQERKVSGRNEPCRRNRWVRLPTVCHHTCPSRGYHLPTSPPTAPLP